MSTVGKSATLASDIRLDAFRSEGVLHGIPLLAASQCDLLIKHLRSMPPPPQPLDWNKGRAASDRLFYDIATQPHVLELVKTLLGPDFALWGAVVVKQSAGDVHAWHSDIETAHVDGNSVSIWVGLQNTHSESTLELVTRSHHAGKSIQQVAVEHGLSRNEVTSEMALDWARECDPRAELVCPVTKDGYAVAFDGRIWHASFNRHPRAQRSAIVLQYAAADVPVRMPDFSQLEWPFRFKASPKPPVISVSGESNSGANRLVPPPRYESKPEVPLSSHVHPLELPLAEDAKSRWKRYPVMRGRTRIVGSMNAHVSVLSPGHSPHPPHEHSQEELLIVLEGRAELIILDGNDGNDGNDGREERLEPVQAGTFVYYPAYCKHTIRNTGNQPVTYLMFRWSAPSLPIERALPCQKHEFGPFMQRKSGKPFATTTLFEGATAYLSKLHAHTSIVQPGAGYAEHVDGHDAVIVLQSGKVETLGRIIEGPGVVYFSAGEKHGLRNLGDEPVRYLVFEFHSPAAVDLEGPIPIGPRPTISVRLHSGLLSIRKSLKRTYNRGRKLLGRKSGLAGYVLAMQKKFRVGSE